MTLTGASSQPSSATRLRQTLSALRALHSDESQAPEERRATARSEGAAFPDADINEAAWRYTCFYSSPIGETGSEQREHSDGLLNVLVRPAIAALDQKMGVNRADRLPSSPITADIFKHVFRSRLLIADLSFHRPNVLHEVGLRHATGKPCVLISRKEDPIPSNLKDVRVVAIDTARVWDFVSDIETRRAELTAYARWALSAEGQDSSPVHKFFPDYRRHIA